MITLIYGPNAYRRTEALAQIVDDISLEAIERYDGEVMTPSQLHDALQGATLFATHKLVIVRDLSLNKSLWDELAARAVTIPDETHLVLIETAPDKRLKTFKALQKSAKVIACNELSEVDLITWIHTKAKAANASIDKRLAQLIIERVGVDQQRIAQELDKLFLLPGHLTAEVIAEVIDSNERGDVFALLDAVLREQIDVVRAQLTRLRHAEDPYRLYGLLVSQVVALSLVWAGQKLSPETLAKQTGLHPFVIRKLSGVARGLHRSDLTNVVHELVKLDDQLKSSSLEAWELLEVGFERLASR